MVREYNCTTDGLPIVLVIASQGALNPTVEFSVPLFANCSDAEERMPAQLPPGTFPSLCKH